jgi:imidazolonepropionase-like amidohydrolase
MKPLVLAQSILALLAFTQSSAIAEPVAIENATIHTGAGKTIDGASILIDRGVIRAIGKKIQIPTAARRISGKGKIVTPGFIDAASRLGLAEVDAVSSTVEGSFADSVQAGYRVLDGYNPASVAIPVARAGGVTTVIAVPTGGLVAGQSAAFRTLGDSVNKALLRESIAVHARLGRKSTGDGDGSRGRSLERLRELFDDARHYARNRSAFDRNQTRRYNASRLDLEALLQVTEGKKRLWLEVNRRSDIEAALRLARSERIRIAIIGGAEAWLVAKELAEAKVPVVVNPTHNLPSSFDEIMVRDDAPQILSKAGVTVLLSPLGAASEARTLRQLAGIAVSNGMGWQEALAAITSKAASLANLDVGILKVGAPADLVLWSGDPFELDTRAEQVIIAGELQTQDSHQSELFRRYRDPKSLK